LEDSVVVVTGATSGVGRASAHAFAGHRARLVLAARDRDALDDVVLECQRRGGRAVAVPTDITVAGDLERLAASAVATFGRIDTWVNAAGALVAGPLGGETVEEIDQLLDTNVRGTLLASRAALVRFREQRSGVLINVSSLLGVFPNPVVPIYTMTKFAVRGLSLALYHQSAAWPGVDVCTVLPGAIDTPLFQRAANHTGWRLRAIATALAPERVAATVVSCARRPRRQAVVGWVGRGLLVAHRVAPATAEWATARAVARLLVRHEAAPDTSGELFGPEQPAHLHGGWRKVAARRRAGEAMGRLASRRGA
jgi:NADP-dependent 3-hydroxy acid dehydrogenase YdfG